MAHGRGQRPLDHAAHGGGHANENDGQGHDVDGGGQAMAAGEHGLQDGQLADEQAKGRRTADGQEASRPQGGGYGQRPGHAPGVVAGAGVVDGQDVAGNQKQRALGQRMVDGVEHGPEGRAAADADAKGQDAHVLDAGVGQHPFVVAQADDKNSGRDHGDEAEKHQQLAAKGPQPGRGQNLHGPQDAQEGAVEERAGE